MLENTLVRLAPLADASHTLVLTNASLAEAIASMMPTLAKENIIAEPRPAGTAAALSWAAAEIARRDGADAIMISVHADWAIGDAEGFRAALRRAAEVAQAHAALVTIGIVPRRADTGFGYIRPGEAVDGEARHMAEQARFAVENGIPKAALQRNGDIVRLAPDGPKKVGEARVGRLVLDGDVILPADGATISERRKIAFGGLITVAVPRAPDRGLAGPILVRPFGVPVEEDRDDFIADAVDAASHAFDSKLGEDQLREALRLAVALRHRMLARRPVAAPAARPEPHTGPGKRPAAPPMTLPAGARPPHR
jgi:hypothetical protein